MNSNLHDVDDCIKSLYAQKGLSDLNQTYDAMCSALAGTFSEQDRLKLETLYQRESYWHERLAELEKGLFLDPLTGLFNIRFLDHMLHKEIKKAERHQNRLSILVLDLDNFKTVNDRFGHLFGNEVLKQFAALLKQTIRETDTAIRYGGDEFIVILSETSPDSAVYAAERIRESIANACFSHSDLETSMTVSIGIASYPEHGRDRDAILHTADLCLYSSKAKGKNTTSLAKTTLEAATATTRTSTLPLSP